MNSANWLRLRRDNGVTNPPGSAEGHRKNVMAPIRDSSQACSMQEAEQSMVDARTRFKQSVITATPSLPRL
jgi:hypothetical protein